MFIERLWRSLKFEDIYLKRYSDRHEAKAGIARWMKWTPILGRRAELEGDFPFHRRSA